MLSTLMVEDGVESEIAELRGEARLFWLRSDDIVAPLEDGCFEDEIDMPGESEDFVNDATREAMGEMPEGKRAMRGSRGLAFEAGVRKRRRESERSEEFKISVLYAVGVGDDSC